MSILRWGIDIDSNELVSIEKALRGKDCNCICPACGSQLIAHKASIAHHFKHFNTTECSGGAETAIHLKAKEIIASSLKLKLPALKASAYLDDYKAFIKILDSKFISFDDVCLEKKEGKIIPDLIAIHKGKKLLIEIAVTHFIDGKKKKIIREQGVSCIEINLENFHKSEINFTDDDFEYAVISCIENKKWIYNAKYNKAKIKAAEKASYLRNKIIKEEKEKIIREKRLFIESFEDMLKAGFKIKINPHNICSGFEKGSNYVEFSINLDLYGIKDEVKSQDHLILIYISVCRDDNSMFFLDVETKSSSISYPLLESYIEKNLYMLSSEEGLYRWLCHNVDLE